MRNAVILFFCWSLLLLPGLPSWADSPARAMKEGIRAYDAGKYKKALSRFEAAEVEAPDDPKIRYNAAAGRYKTGDFASAAKEFEQVLSKTNDPKLKAKVYYNLGNTAYRKKALKEASEFYRKALAIIPEDRQAKENLEFVLKALKQQKKQQQPDGGKQKSPENQKDRDQNKNQKKTSSSHQSQGSKGGEKASQDHSSKKTQNQKEEEAKRDQPNPSPEKGKQAKTETPPGPPIAGAPLSPEEAKRLLNSLSDDQRAYFRAQAAGDAPRKKSVREDW